MSRLLSVVLLTLLAASLSAQTPPAFRAGANFIRVDMYATRDGQLVGDLKPEEIEVLEDGTAQKIETFERIDVRTGLPPAARIEPNTVADSRQMATDPRARVFVIFLDTLHSQIEGSPNMRLPLVRFLDRVLGPDDLVAVMTPEMLARDVTFARKTTVISNIMQTEWTWGRRGTNNLDPKERLYEDCYPTATNSATTGIAAEMIVRRREKMTLDALDDLVLHLGTLREERKAVVTVSEGWRLVEEDRRLASVVRGRGTAPPEPFATAPRTAAEPGRAADRSMVRECEADRVLLAMMSNRRRLRDLTEAANRGNVSFYPVYARGLAAFDAPVGPEPPPGLMADRATLGTRQNSLRELASDTDGIAVVNTSELDAAMNRIAADLSSYYLLGYTSTNGKLDGRFRSIAVRVKRPGVQVRARRGYRGLTAEQLLGVAEGERRERAAPTSVVVNPRARFRMWTAAWTPDGRPPAAWIVGELDHATRRELAWSAGASAEVVLVAADGREVLTSRALLPAGEGAFSLRIPESAALAPGDYAVRVRVRPESEQALPVTDAVRLIVPASATVMGDAVMWRRGPSTGLKHVVTADPHFQRSERVRFEIPTMTAGAATGRMLDRAGNPMRVPVQMSERQEPSEPFRWIVADVVLAPLAPGDYSIEVSLAGSKRAAALKVVP